MRRFLCFIGLIALSASLAGCSGDSVNDTGSSSNSPETAKAAAAKMPPPSAAPKK